MKTKLKHRKKGELSGFFDSFDSTTLNFLKVGLIIGVIGIGTVVFFKIKKGIKNRKANSASRKNLKDLEKEGITPTLKDTEFAPLAEELYKAMDGLGTNTTVVFSCLKRLQNAADWYKLEETFGTKKDTSWFSNIGEARLGTWLSSELSDSEKEEINKYFRSKQIPTIN